MTSTGFAPASGSLYSLDLDGTIADHLSGISLTNGMAFSNDNTILFYIDSGPQTIYAYDYDLTTGNISEFMLALLVLALLLLSDSLL